MDYEIFRTLVQLQSLALTVPLLALCFAVLWEIRKPTNDVCWKEDKTPEQKKMCWILVGLFFGFAGKVIESIWWAIPWTMDYIDHPAWFEFNSLGVFFNIVFRQAFFTISAYCHLRAFAAPDKQSRGMKTVHWILGISLIMGQLYMITLLEIKPLN